MPAKFLILLDKKEYDLEITYRYILYNRAVFFNFRCCLKPSGLPCCDTKYMENYLRTKWLENSRHLVEKNSSKANPSLFLYFTLSIQNISSRVRLERFPTCDNFKNFYFTPGAALERVPWVLWNPQDF